MKIALCLSGYVGYTQKFPPRALPIDISEGYSYISENIMKGYDVDVFVHSWDKKRKKEILKTYKPRAYCIEKQKEKFKVDPRPYNKQQSTLVRGYTFGDILFHVQSQKYSRKRVIEIKNKYEEENNVKYDWVFLTRFDMAFLKKFRYENLDNEKIYLAGPIRQNGNHIDVNDFYYLSNSKNMDVIAGMYDYLPLDAKKWEHNIHRLEGKYLRHSKKEKILTPLFQRAWMDRWNTGDIRVLRHKPNIKTKKI